MGPSKKMGMLFIFFVFVRSMEKMAWNGTEWGQEDFFLLIQTLPTFGAEWIWILRICMFCDLLDPKFLEFQVSRSQNSQISGFPGYPPCPFRCADGRGPFTNLPVYAHGICTVLYLLSRWTKFGQKLCSTCQGPNPKSISILDLGLNPSAGVTLMGIQCLYSEHP